jgi:hypothetical protein
MYPIKMPVSSPPAVHIAGPAGGVKHSPSVNTLSSLFSFSSHSSQVSHNLRPSPHFGAVSVDSERTCVNPSCNVDFPHTYSNPEPISPRPDDIQSVHIRRFQISEDPFPNINCWEAFNTPSFTPWAGRRIYLFGYGVVRLRATGIRLGRWELFSCEGGLGAISTRVAFQHPKPATWARVRAWCVYQVAQLPCSA